MCTCACLPVRMCVSVFVVFLEVKCCSSFLLWNMEGPPSPGVDLDFDDLHMETADPFDPAYAYRVSKLCNVLFTYELQRRLQAEGRCEGISQ